jgi:hypothetical protein
MAAKRRLPVVQDPPEDGEEPRPAWHWVGFGAVGVFATWLPLAWVAGRIAAAATSSLVAGATSEDEIRTRIALMDSSERTRYTALSIAPQLGGLALAALAGGYLVGRWGSGTREAALAGAAAATVASLFAIAGGGASYGVVLVIGIAALFGWLGGKLGVRRKRA